jgi:hypothetical protein
MKHQPPDGPDLFDWAHARASDPLTSHEAVPVNITAQALRILRAYYEHDRAILDNDAYRLAGLESSRAKSQRCSDLRKVGFIERTGERGQTPSGHSGYLCRITPEGRAFLTGRR